MTDLWRTFRIALGGAPLIALAACFLPGFEKVDATATGGGSGSSTAGTGGAGGEGGSEDPCSVRWPAQEPGTSKPTDNVVIELAMRTIDIGDADPTVAPGFDLDRACTCCEGCPPAQTCTPPGEILCDAPRGRDNATAHFLDRLERMVASPVTSASLKAEIDAGTWTILMRVWGYNGLPDDDEVVVALYATGATAPPAWTGQDMWPVREDSLVPMATSVEQALVRSDIAYVTDGTLVGTFGATSPLRLSLTGGFDIWLTQAILSGTLEPVNDTFKLTGATLGGLWTMPDVFRSLANLRANGVAVVCKGEAVYEGTIKPLLCSLRDGRPGFDTPTPCDSLSFGTAFTSEPAILSGIVAPPDPGMPCAAGTEPNDDVCP